MEVVRHSSEAGSVDEKHANRAFSFVAVVVCLAVFAAVAWWRGGSLLRAALGAAAPSSGELVAVVRTSDGGEERLPLGEDVVRAYETELGLNVVVVEDGSVRISEADCANQICVREGAISQVGEQLVCLPHRFSVEIVSTGPESADIDGYDTVSR